ncbi:unnamed protein product [Protopolystoma xenopodis]|uniref:Uncharacterized protein n=1 Tax=Protopolystoma xenopodis TaxID=117903 RepID=A0A3S5FG61_9PLAT|nr:unnamed protein product [Protopolystoma xenopodis]
MYPKRIKVDWTVQVQPQTSLLPFVPQYRQSLAGSAAATYQACSLTGVTNVNGFAVATVRLGATPSSASVTLAEWTANLRAAVNTASASWTGLYGVVDASGVQLSVACTKLFGWGLCFLFQSDPILAHRHDPIWGYLSRLVMVATQCLW